MCWSLDEWIKLVFGQAICMTWPPYTMIEFCHVCQICMCQAFVLCSLLWFVDMVFLASIGFVRVFGNCRKRWLTTHWNFLSLQVMDYGMLLQMRSSPLILNWNVLLPLHLMFTIFHSSTQLFSLVLQTSRRLFPWSNPLKTQKRQPRGWCRKLIKGGVLTISPVLLSVSWQAKRKQHNKAFFKSILADYVCESASDNADETGIFWKMKTLESKLKNILTERYFLEQIYLFRFLGEHELPVLLKYDVSAAGIYKLWKSRAWWWCMNL